MAGSITFYPISAMQLRKDGDKEIYESFLEIAKKECEGKQVEAFRKIVREATDKRKKK